MKKVTTSQRLKEIMKEKNLKQVDILELAKPYCKKYNIKLNKNDLSQYVSGKVEPGQYKLTILGHALNVSEAWLMGYDVPKLPSINFDNNVDNNKPTTKESVLNGLEQVKKIFSESAAEFDNDEEIHLEKYRTLDKYGKKAVDSVLNIEYERCTFIENDSEDEEPTFEITYSELPVSAGTGEFLSEEMTSIIEIPDTPFNRTADFVVQVSGRSMEPEFYDEDLLLVRKQPSVYEGEIGIFVKNGCGYIKKFGGDKLISINPDYDDIQFNEYDTLVCYGKVIGKV